MLEDGRTLNAGHGMFKVGDEVSVTITHNGTHEAAAAMAVKQSGEAMIFCFIDCLRKEYPMNKRDTNAGGYEASDLRKALRDEILPMFPEQLVLEMVPFDDGDLLRIPSEKELFGVNRYGTDEPENMTQWEPMKIRRNRIARLGRNGAPDWYWLQNPWLRGEASESLFVFFRDSESLFASVHDSGCCHADRASRDNGVRPVFQIRNWP